ncbi:unnamed protein product, partial [Staurois parvus]
ISSCQAPPNGISSGLRHGVSQDAESKSQSAFSPGPLMVGMDLVQDWNQVAPLGTPGGGRGVPLRVCARDEPAVKGMTGPIRADGWDDRSRSERDGQMTDLDPSGMDG